MTTRQDRTAKRQATILDHAMAKGWVGFRPTQSNTTAVPDPGSGCYKVARFTGQIRTQEPGEIQVEVGDHVYFDDARKPATHAWLLLSTMMKGNRLYPLLGECPPAFMVHETALVPETSDDIDSTRTLVALSKTTEQLLVHTKVQAGAQSELITAVRELVTATRDLTAAMELNAQAIADQQRPPLRRRPLRSVDTQGEPVQG